MRGQYAHGRVKKPDIIGNRNMKFFVDTADVAAIAELNDLGFVDGVTTNPSLILKSGRDILEVTKEICAMIDGPVSAEVVALKADDMIAEGRKLAKIADNIAVKVPLTWDGLKACKVLSDEGINIKVITTSEIKISVLVDRKYMELAVQALHDAFELDKV